MRPLSAEMNHLTKWVIPILGFLGVCAYMLWKESLKPKPEFGILLSVLVMCAVIFVWVFKRRIWSLADEVLDGGDHLVVRFGTREASVPLSNISKVNIDSQLGSTTVRLQLATPCEFGAVISFLARSTSRNPFASNEVAEELAGRVNRGDGRGAV